MWMYFLGTAEIDEDLPLEQAREDPHRQDYLAVHFAQLLEAIRYVDTIEIKNVLKISPTLIRNKKEPELTI